MLQVRLAVFLDVRLEAFKAKEFCEIFSDGEQRQDAKAFRVREVTQSQFSRCAGDLVEPKLLTTP